MQYLEDQWVFQKQEFFGLYDLIGIDLMADVLKSFIKELSDHDEFQIVAKEITVGKKID